MTRKIDTVPTDYKFDVAIIDLDPLVYRCGYATEKKCPDTGMCIVEPLNHVFYNINSMMKQCLKMSGTELFKGYLTEPGKSNFRFDVYRYYKENRVKCSLNCDDPHPYDCHEKEGHVLLGKKPVWYKEIREYCKTRWKGDSVSGMEADDACSIAQYEFNPHGFNKEDRNSIVWSFDKDFNNFPGWHGNYLTKEIYYVEPIEAMRNFYLQILTGDVSDNIPRVKYRWLKAKTEKALQKAETEKEMIEIIWNDCYTALCDENDVDPFIERNGRLVHLLRYPEEVWHIPEFHQKIEILK